MELPDPLVCPLYEICDLRSLLALCIFVMGLYLEILKLFLCQLVFQVVILYIRGYIALVIHLFLVFLAGTRQLSTDFEGAYGLL